MMVHMMRQIDIEDRVMVYGKLAWVVIGSGMEKYPVGNVDLVYRYYWVRIDGGKPLRAASGHVRRLKKEFSLN